MNQSDIEKKGRPLGLQNSKVIRSICYFTDNLDRAILEKVNDISARLEADGYTIQTKRICLKGFAVKEISSAFHDSAFYLSVGTLGRESAHNQFHDFLNTDNVSFNLDLSRGVQREDTDILFHIIQNRPGKTFNFSYTFCNAPSSPYFPSATHGCNGFSIGLQSTDLSENCKSIDEWLKKVKAVWNELFDMFQWDPDFLGIDSSIAPLFAGKSSFIYFIKKENLDGL